MYHVLGVLNESLFIDVKYKQSLYKNVWMDVQMAENKICIVGGEIVTKKYDVRKCTYVRVPMYTYMKTMFQ